MDFDHFAVFLLYEGAKNDAVSTENQRFLNKFLFWFSFHTFETHSSRRFPRSARSNAPAKVLNTADFANFH